MARSILRRLAVTVAAGNTIREPLLMRIRPVQLGAFVSSLGAILLGPCTASAELPHAPATASSGTLTRDEPNKASAPTFGAAQLDQLLAPIDLYSDALLSQIFLA